MFGLNWIQTVCNSYQQTTLVGTELKNLVLILGLIRCIWLITKIWGAWKEIIVFVYFTFTHCNYDHCETLLQFHFKFGIKYCDKCFRRNFRTTLTFACWVIFHAFVVIWLFSILNFFKKVFQEHYHTATLMVWIQTRNDVPDQGPNCLETLSAVVKGATSNGTQYFESSLFLLRKN